MDGRTSRTLVWFGLGVALGTLLGSHLQNRGRKEHEHETEDLVEISLETISSGTDVTGKQCGSRCGAGST